MRTNKCGVIADRHIGMVDDNEKGLLSTSINRVMNRVFRPVVV